MTTDILTYIQRITLVTAVLDVTRVTNNTNNIGQYFDFAFDIRYRVGSIGEGVYVSVT